MVNNLQQMHLKLLRNEKFKKQQEKLVISLVIKLLIKLWISLKKLQQDNSKSVTNEHENIYSDQRQTTIDDLRLI